MGNKKLRKIPYKRGNCLKNASFWVINSKRFRVGEKNNLKRGGGMIEMHNIYPWVRVKKFSQHIMLVFLYNPGRIHSYPGRTMVLILDNKQNNLRK